MRIISFIIVAVLAFALAADAVATTPRYSDVSRADWSAILAAGSEAAFPADTCGGQRPSDYHVYDMRGRPFVQRRDSFGAYWTRGGRVVASLYHRAFVSDTNRARIRVAVWCG